MMVNWHPKLLLGLAPILCVFSSCLKVGNSIFEIALAATMQLYFEMGKKEFVTKKKMIIMVEKKGSCHKPKHYLLKDHLAPLTNEFLKVQSN